LISSGFPAILMFWKATGFRLSPIIPWQRFEATNDHAAGLGVSLAPQIVVQCLLAIA
jgi:hypothetical protein